MTTTDYILNALFVFFVLRQTRESRIDARSILIPLSIVFFVAHSYIHSIPTSGNDLMLIGALAAVGTTLGILGGIATHVRVDSIGKTFTRVGWVAGALLIGGFGTRMAFVLASENGAAHAIGSFSAANHIGAAAWPIALVSMALLEVVIRIAVVQLRAYRLKGGAGAAAGALPVSA